MSEHIATKKAYIAVWAALICLTAATAGVSYLELGRFNVVVALIIATCKASLVYTVPFVNTKYVATSQVAKLAFGFAETRKVFMQDSSPSPHIFNHSQLSTQPRYSQADSIVSWRVLAVPLPEQLESGPLSRLLVRPS